MRRQKDLKLDGNDYQTYRLEPMTKVHLYSPFPTFEPNGNITYIYILAVVALLILGIAAVNYTNLATSQSVQRLPEIGIRKVMGSPKWQLFWQFIGESLLVNLFAFVLAVAAAIIALPLFIRLVERNLTINAILNPIALGLIFLLYLLISVIAQISIRKVLGAGAIQIVTMVAGDFVKLVAAAAIIAFPVAWVSMDSWLQSFAYRVNMGWLVFVVAGLCATVIALLAVSVQALRAANMNPVKSLKSE